MNSRFNRNDHLVRLAERGQRLTPLLLAVVLVFVIYDGGILVGIGGVTLLQQPPFRSLIGGMFPALGSLLFQVILYTPIYLLVWIWLRWFEKRPFSTLGLERNKARTQHMRGILIGLLMISGWVGLQAVTGHLVFEGIIDVGTWEFAGFCAVLVLTYLARAVQVAIEEVLFRGWLLPTIGARYGIVAGILGSSLLFSLSHFWRPLALLGIGNLHDPWPPFIAINIFLWAVFVALWALRDGSIWGPIAFHTTTLWAYSFIFGFGDTTVGSLLEMRLVNPSWLTGGVEFSGVFEGLPATVLLLLGILMIRALS